MLNTDKVILSPLYSQRINNLHEDKLKINDIKMQQIGHLDFDDWGFVHYPDFKFEAKPNHPSGIVFGYVALGEHLRRFFNEIPKYINKNSALAQEAGKMAEVETDEATRKNLLEMADINAWLVNNPPRTLREACQFIAHFQTLDRTYFVGGALDQLDEALRPFYDKDINDGILTDEQAVWYIASLFFNDTHYSQIAGLTPDGCRDMTSRMSFIILDAMHYLRIPANIALRVNDKVNPVLLKRSLEYIMEDGTGVSYSCNVGCEQGYARNGFPIQLARMRCKVGCNWTAIP